MKIVIAGGTGFLGRPLAARLAADGHDVVILARTRAANVPGARIETWTPTGEVGTWARVLDGTAVVVNLAGESIAGARWSAAHKARIRESRILATRSLVEAIRHAATPPAVFVSGSAVGYYGPHGDETVTEETPPGADFLAGVCVDWETEAKRAAESGTRVVLVRTGLVLEGDGGALKQMLLPFKLGVGGSLGSGRQFWPWIHRSDWIDLVSWALKTSPLDGAVNATAPNPVTNAEFTRVLGHVLHRPAFLPAPGFALKIMLGEMADALLLSGQRAVPAKAQRLGFEFRYTSVEEALRAALAAPSNRGPSVR